MGIKSDKAQWNHIQALYKEIIEDNEHHTGTDGVFTTVGSIIVYKIDTPGGYQKKAVHLLSSVEALNSTLQQSFSPLASYLYDFVIGIHGHIEDSIDIPFSKALTYILDEVLSVNFLDESSTDPYVKEALNFFTSNPDAPFNMKTADDINTDTNAEIKEYIEEIEYWDKQFDYTEAIEEKLGGIFEENNIKANIKTDQDWQNTAIEFAKWLYTDLYGFPYDEQTFDAWFSSWFVLTTDEKLLDGSNGITYYDSTTHEVTAVYISIIGHEDWTAKDWEERFMTIVHEMRHVYQHKSYNGQLNVPGTPIDDEVAGSYNDDYYGSDTESDAYMWEEMSSRQ